MCPSTRQGQQSSPIIAYNGRDYFLLAQRMFGMKQISRSLLSALAGAAVLLTTGCQEQNVLTAPKGALSFSVAWPKAPSATQAGFVIQAIPDQTQKISLRIE